MEKNIYNLKLHEKIKFDQIEIIRVPGGWIYNHQRTQVNIENPCFVPFHEEFKKPKQKKLFEEGKLEKFNPKEFLLNLGVNEKIASDWLKVRRGKATNTETAFNAIKKEILKTKANPNDCISMAVKYSWKGFEAEWYFNKLNKSGNNEKTNKLQSEF